MSSIIEGYNYDIFISYRQKDNKHDGWVTKFVENLKGELEATFKEDVSVYFDENPHDRLQETHNVDKSLEGKLKCLIFIPILSQTYCDPNSYAWQYEFLAFNKLAKDDNFGRDIRLRSGNVASRILPIRTHDLEQEDIKLYEKETGSVLRAMDFVFKTSTGVNRPLKVNEDHPQDNLNKTFYADQINKVANAIKEIILGMKRTPVSLVKEETHNGESSEGTVKEEISKGRGKFIKSNKVKLIPALAVVALLIIAAIIAYPKLFKKDTLKRLQSSGEGISVAVMPFQNMTNDTIWNIWQQGIQNELASSLTNSEELKVRQTELINSLIQSKGVTDYASLTPSFARSISQKLDADVFIFGSIKKVGDLIRVNAQLIDSQTEDSFKSFQLDGTEEKILHITDSLSVIVRDFLIISIMEKEIIKDFRPLISTNSSEAYRYYMYGNQAFYKLDFSTASEWYKKAIDIDSCFYEATRMLIFSLAHQGLREESIKLLLKNHNERDQMSVQQKIWSDISYSQCFETPIEEIKHFKLLIALDDEMPVPHYNLAVTYMKLKLYEQAIYEYEKELGIYNKWGVQPRWVLSYTFLGEAYHKSGLYKKENKLYRNAEKYFPESPDLIRRQAILSLSLNKSRKANEYLKKYISDQKAKSLSEADIAFDLALIYSEANLFDKAEKYYREALSLKPDNLTLLNDLAFFLIDKDRNIKEGLGLVDKAYMLGLDEFNYADAKGLGLYKQGKYEEALKLLERSWELKPSYDHELYLHIEAARKAVAGQMNN